MYTVQDVVLLTTQERRLQPATCQQDSQVFSALQLLHQRPQHTRQQVKALRMHLDRLLQSLSAYPQLVAAYEAMLCASQHAHAVQAEHVALTARLARC